jgi:hypothetical protein
VSGCTCTAVAATSCPSLDEVQSSSFSFAVTLKAEL